jgi:hypothetical protein
MAGVARALSFTCPLSALEAGYNTFRIAPETAAEGLHMVWVELRFEPE